jgi:hypothetical protein
MAMRPYGSTRFDRCVLTRPLHGRFRVRNVSGANQTPSGLEEPIRRHTVRHAHGLIVAARSERERVASTYDVPGERIAAVPNPVDAAALGS